MRHAALPTKDQQAPQSSAIALATRAAQTGGAPIPGAVRQHFESRFGHDFSQVRVHADDEAALAARAVAARAFTVGSDIVFGRGEYPAHSHEGHKLLAHELAHVVQQERVPSRAPVQAFSCPHHPAEREADVASQAVLSGRRATPREIPSAGLHRKMHNKTILEPVRPNARACLVHLHGEEHTAAAVAQELYGRRCVNYVHLDTDQGPLTGVNQRYVEFDVDVSANKKGAGSAAAAPAQVNYTCTADPNRIFSEAGRKQTVKCKPTRPDAQTTGVSSDDVNKAAVAEIGQFATAEWSKGISQCRAGSGTPDLAGPLPVLALHNNEGASPILDKYKPQWAPANDPRLKGASNPDYSADPNNQSDVFFVADPPAATGTAAPDFDAIRGKYNVGLQAQNVPTAGQDGSLSVALQDQRFINVEKKGRDHGKLVKLPSGFQGHDSVYIKNYAMAVNALDVFNVPEGPCPAAAPATGGQSNAAPTPPTSGGPSPAPQPATAAPKLDAEAKQTEAYPRQKVEDKDVPIQGCLHFEPGTIASRKSFWDGQLATLPVLDVVNWIVGAWDLKATAAPNMPKVVKDGVHESFAQRDCLLAAMRSGVNAQGGKLPKGNLLASGARSFSDQKAIWEDKWSFRGAHGKTFDRISNHAAVKSKGLLTEGDKWDTTNTLHNLMWGVLEPTNKKDSDVAVFLQKGATKLSDQEREQEILMASSAPGVSRHHAGTDFDIGEQGSKKDELEPELWKPGGKYFDAGRWLAHNAATWGFMRPFESKGGYGKGYMAEPWHWSYWPIAQALLEFARKNQTDMEGVLHAHWGDSSKKPQSQFQFIWAAWKNFVSNVDETPQF